MRADHHSPPVIRRAAYYWHLVRHGYRYANRLTYQAFGIVLRMTIFVYFLFGLAFLGLRYQVMPHIDRYKPAVERLASDAIGRQVTIRNIYASWRGVRPYLFLGGVVIHDRHGRQALTLPGVSATFSWWSVVRMRPGWLRNLEISRPDLTIERDESGNLFVAGIPVDTRQEGSGKGLDWVLSQDQIVIRDGSLRWRDGLRRAPELELKEINLLMRNRWLQHQFALTAAAPADTALPLDIRANFRHPFLSDQVSDVAQWAGELYIDLRNADLAAWKAYVDYPVDIGRGRGSVRSWLTFDHAKVADFTTDLVLADVSTRLGKDLEPLNLTTASGRISVRERFDPEHPERKPSFFFGRAGHSLSLTDFTMRTEDGLYLPQTTISEAHVPASGGEPDKTSLDIRSLDLGMLAGFVERLPLPAAQRQLLNDFAPHGYLHDFKARWQGAYPDISSYDVKGRFIGLSLKAQAARPARPKTAGVPVQAAVPAIPGFDNLTGSIEADTRGGRLNLDSQRLKLDLPGYFVDPVIAFDRLRMQARWSLENPEVLLFEVPQMEIVQNGLAATLTGRHTLPLAGPPGHLRGSLDLDGRVATMDVTRIGPLLPSATPEHLRHWLSEGLEGGTLKDVRIRIKGDLAAFPFNQDGPGRKAAGEFTVAGKIEDGKLNYTPGVFGRDGKSPLWPVLEDINGTISFDRKRLDIFGETAKTHGVAFSKVRAGIADLFSHDTLLTIEGDGNGSLQEMVSYTADSPVGEWIGRFTDQTRTAGNAALNLRLELPLGHINDARVQGTLHFAGNEIGLMDGLPALGGTQGKLHFNEHGFTLDGVRANVFGGQAIIAGGSQRDGSVLVKATGALTGPGLRKAFGQPAIQRLAERVSGGTRYNVSVAVRKKRPEVVVESSLSGVALDLPAPLRKAASESLPLRFELLPVPGDDTAMLRDELKLSLGSFVTARYQRQKPADHEGAWHVVRGGIGINEPAPIPDSGVIANVNVKSLNLDAWSQVLSSLSGGEKSREQPGGASDMSEYLEPEMLAARATELIVGGKKLDNVVVGASHQKSAWQANVDSEQASGWLTWNEPAPGQSIGKVTAHLASLKVPKSAASEVGDILEGKSASAQIPALDIVADNFELFGKKFGRLDLQASNVPGSAAREWRIDKLVLSNPDAELTAKGKWTPGGGDTASSLNYNLEIINAGKLLDRLGFVNVMRNGKGKMSGNLTWKGLPFSFDVPSLAGQIRLEVRSGQIMNVDLGGAKLLGVLSLQGLPRLGDVIAEGLTFDTILADAAISQGVLKTENFKMRSVNMTAAIEGSVDLNKETQNLRAVIIPDYNLGTPSVVYGLMVNPAVGVGTFLAQLFLREPIAKALTVEYRITGPWKEPVYTKLDRKKEGRKEPTKEADAHESAG